MSPTSRPSRVLHCNHQIIIGDSQVSAHCGNPKCNKHFDEEHLFPLFETNLYSQQVIYVRAPDTTDHDIEIALEGIDDDDDDSE
jgi:hypothetical protein